MFELGNVRAYGLMTAAANERLRAENARLKQKIVLMTGARKVAEAQLTLMAAQANLSKVKKKIKHA